MQAASKAHWKSRIIKTIAWLVTEIALNLVGLDTFADYSEFIFGREFSGPLPIQPTITALL